MPKANIVCTAKLDPNSSGLAFSVINVVYIAESEPTNNVQINPIIIAKIIGNKTVKPIIKESTLLIASPSGPPERGTTDSELSEKGGYGKKGGKKKQGFY